MEFKESKDNPLHRDYGLWSNTRFVLNRARKYCPLVFLLGSTDLFCPSPSVCLRRKSSAGSS